MKKFAKTFVAAAFAVITVLGASLMLAACGETKVAATTGFYTSQNSYSYTNFAPTYNYRTLTYKTQNIETFDDGTYILYVNATTYSNVTFGEGVATNECTANPQGSTLVRYYGTYSAVTDDDGITLTLNVPTRVYDVNFGRLPIDTANWTDAMTEYMENWTFQGQPMGKDENGNTYTAETYLKKVTSGFTESVEVFISPSTCSFTAIKGV